MKFLGLGVCVGMFRYSQSSISEWIKVFDIGIFKSYTLKPNKAAGQRFAQVRSNGSTMAYIFMSPGKNHNLGSKNPSRLRRLSAPKITDIPFHRKKLRRLGLV